MIIIIRRKSLFLWYSFTFTVVITHKIITFQAICMDKIPKDFTSMKDTDSAALKPRSYLKGQGTVTVLSCKFFIWVALLNIHVNLPPGGQILQFF